MNLSDAETTLVARLLLLRPDMREAAFDLAAKESPDLCARRQAILDSITAGLREHPSLLPISEQGAVRALELALTSASDEVPGVRIGPYKLHEKIGEGGFGIVWLAEQQIPIRRCLAVKIIKVGMDTEEVIARFEAERQALALMDHPNIARVVDAGTTAAGRPFFVMELVRGVAITRYCDENRLPARARLQLFISVCHAVQHAHQKGVIHRDLKPSNILVTLHDGVPVPKIIDFGIAKATSTRLTEKTFFTQFHAFIGTPAYTSPEQMELSGLDIDTRSDIYSLGVLLYELLTGHPPFDPDELVKSGLEAMRRTIREVDPLRPSRRVGTLSAELRTSVAARLSTDAAKLPLLLRGDLDWIVMRCLEKDRARRYDTANSLAADVRNYLNDETVSARPASAAYRFHKLVRRNRLAFFAGAGVALALIAGLVIASVSFLRERAALRREAALRLESDTHAAEARLAAAKSAEVARFMKEMFKGAGPSVALGRDTAMLREILDATVRRLDRELRDQPAVAADLRDTLGAVYFDLGQYPAAEPLLRESVMIHRAISDGDSLETATSLHLHGTALRRINRMDDAEAALQEALSIRRKRLGEGDPAVADTLYELSFLVGPQRALADRRALMEQVLAIRRRAFGPVHPAVAQAIAGLGYLAQSELDHEKGARYHTEALAMRRQLLGNEHPDVAASLDAIGYSFAHELDRKSEAAAAYLEAFTIRRKVLGDLHPGMVVSLLRFTGQKPARDVDAETLAMVRGFVAGQRKGLPRGSLLLAPSLLALASLEARPERNPDEARALVQEARAIIENSRVTGIAVPTEIVDAMWFFAWSKFIANVPAEGQAMSEESLKLAQAALGFDHRMTLLSTHTLAWIYQGLGRPIEAAKQLEAALPLCRSLYGEHHTITGMDLAALGDCYGRTNRAADAHRLLETWLRSYDAIPKMTRSASTVAVVRYEFGRTLLRESRYAEAETVLRRALVDYDLGELRPLNLRMGPRQRAVSALSQALARQGKFTEAEPLAVQAFLELQANEHRIAGDRAGMVREALDAVIDLYRAWGKPEKSAEWGTQFSPSPDPQQ